MGVGIIANEDGAVLYCNTTMQAFGPVFDNEDEANEFLEWLGQDARTLSPKELNDKYDEYTSMEEDHRYNPAPFCGKCGGACGIIDHNIVSLRNLLTNLGG